MVTNGIGTNSKTSVQESKLSFVIFKMSHRYVIVHGSVMIDEYVTGHRYVISHRM